MKAEMVSTDKIVKLVVNGAEIPARIWEGRTDGGVVFHAYITRVAVGLGQDAYIFERELKEQSPPSVEVTGIPLRLIL